MSEREYDGVIIGSGAGGGTVAQELAPLCRDGVRIAVLEKGPRLRDDEFSGRELEMAQVLYEDGGGVLTADGSMTLAMGSSGRLRQFHSSIRSHSTRRSESRRTKILWP